MTKIYTAKEVASILDVNYRTLLTMVKEGKIDALDIKGKIKISQYQLDKFLRGE
jgi:excisionase family DNA binding protein